MSARRTRQSISGKLWELVQKKRPTYLYITLQYGVLYLKYLYLYSPSRHLPSTVYHLPSTIYRLPVYQLLGNHYGPRYFLQYLTLPYLTLPYLD